ncbi:fimbrial protein [Pluralibacter gergoviae]|uniref:fimbrial protein n=1 Tax=Pluralibacter gergoviae TaxID=61647 RepID=UPI003EE2BDE3
MNKLSLVFATALSVACGTALADPVSVNGGKVHFRGEVVNTGCAVDAGSVDQTVQLGQVRSAKLAEAGATSTAVGFNIQLDDCDTTLVSKASIAFSGAAVDSTNTTVLKLDGESYSAATTLNNGPTVLPFQARYYATGVATAGTANADATFKVQYE